MKVYTTKYSLTRGIEEVDVRRPQQKDSGSDYVYTTDRYTTQYRLGHNAFESREDAVAKACQMRDRKVGALEKKIAMLKKLEFK